MEFLMTYGWAILVVMVVIGALAYFGVLNPSQLLPEKCTLQIGFYCKDFQVKNGHILLDILNGAGRWVTIHSIKFTSEALQGEAGCNYSSLTTIENGKHVEFNASGGDCAYKDTGRAKNRYNIEIVYKWTAGRYNHTMKGELLARKED